MNQTRTVRFPQERTTYDAIRVATQQDIVRQLEAANSML